MSGPLQDNSYTITKEKVKNKERKTIPIPEKTGYVQTKN